MATALTKYSSDVVPRAPVETANSIRTARPARLTTLSELPLMINHLIEGHRSLAQAVLGTLVIVLVIIGLQKTAVARGYAAEVEAVGMFGAKDIVIINPSEKPKTSLITSNGSGFLHTQSSIHQVRLL